MSGRLLVAAALVGAVGCGPGGGKPGGGSTAEEKAVLAWVQKRFRGVVALEWGPNDLAGDFAREVMAFRRKGHKNLPALAGQVTAAGQKVVRLKHRFRGMAGPETADELFVLNGLEVVGRSPSPADDDGGDGRARGWRESESGLLRRWCEGE